MCLTEQKWCPEQGATPAACSEKGVGVSLGEQSWGKEGARVWRAYFAVNREEGRGKTGSGDCHNVAEYIKSGWSCRKEAPGGGDKNGRRDHPGAREVAHKAGFERKDLEVEEGPGTETSGEGPYQPRVQLGALPGAPSWKRSERESGRIPEGRARLRAPRSLCSRRRRSQSPAASCPPAGIRGP